MTLETGAERRASEIFLAAVAVDEGRRADFVSSRCGDDATLLSRVQELLGADRGTQGFLAVPAVEQVSRPGQLAAMGLPVLARPGDIVGGYRIIERIGLGGMSQVFSAEAGDPDVGHPVAVKIFYPTPSTSSFHRTFATEAKALTELAHPSIVRLLDGNVTDSGFRFLVMELIEGVAIDRYCFDERLTIEQILEVFGAACAAVSYAHQRLVVHRDLKPSNVLVTGEGVAKLLDFGIAKFLDPFARFDTVTTGLGRAMTPSYASPEQLIGRPTTTASDVYSLGVILFELLTGRLPFDRSRATLEEIRSECETTRPPSPSRMVRQSRLFEEEAAIQRSRVLEGDLDAILGKALQPDPEHRYSSVERLTDDIDRYLRGLPVRARPPSLRYRVRRFVGRNRLFVATVSVLVAVVLTAAATAVVQSIRRAEERDRAVEARGEAERQQSISAEVIDFLISSFEMADPSLHPRNMTALEVLDGGASQLERLDAQPQAQATIRLALGTIYAHLGSYDQAELLLEEALAFRRSQPNPTAVAEVLDVMARLRLDRAEYRVALELAREALATKQIRFGSDHEEVAESLSIVGRAHQALGDLGSAESLHREALSIRERRFGSDHPAVAESLVSLSEVLVGSGARAEARRHAERALELRRSHFGDDHPATEEAWTALVGVLAAASELEAALTVAQHVLEVTEEAFGSDHPRYLSNLSTLGTVHFLLGHFEQAESMIRESIAGSERVLGSEHPEVGSRLSSLGMLLSERGRVAEAEPLLRRGLRIGRRSLGEDHFGVTVLLNNLAINLTRQGEWEEAVALQREAVEICRSRLGAGHLETINRRANLASMLRRRDRRDEAEATFREALSDARTSLPSNHVMTARILRGLTALLIDQRRFEEARPLASEALELYLAITPDDLREIAKMRQKLGMILSGLGDSDEAEAMLLKAYEEVPDQPTATKVRRSILTSLVDLYRDNDADRAARFEAELEESREPS